MTGSDAAILTLQWEPGSWPSPSALWPDDYIVVQKAWPNKGHAHDHETKPSRLQINFALAASLFHRDFSARNALTRRKKSLGGSLWNDKLSPVIGCSKASALA